MANSIIKNTKAIKENALNTRQIYPVYFKGKRSDGMYIGVQNNPSIKENRNILITQVASDNFKDVVQYKSKELYKRRTAMKNSNGEIVGWHEVGEHKIKTKLKRIPLYENILHAWRDVYDYPQVSYGLTAFKREVFVVDSDVVYNSFKDAEDVIKKFCKVSKLPFPSYLLRNPTSGHIQFGWNMNRQFDVASEVWGKAAFNKIIKRLAVAWQIITGCEGDICFNGPSTKNPFYEGFESEIYSFEKVDVDSFIDTLAVVRCDIYKNSASVMPINNASLSLPSYYIDNEQCKQIERKALRRSLSSRRLNGLADLSSRRAYEMNSLRKWIQVHSEYPSFEECFNRIKIYAKEASEVTNKPIHSTNELKEITNTVLNYCKEKHLIGKGSFGDKNCEEANKLREKASLAKKREMFVKAILIRKEGKDLSVRAAAEKFNVSIGAVSKYRKFTNDELAQMKREAVDPFIEYCKSFSELTIDYLEKYKLCVEAVSSFVAVSDSTFVMPINKAVLSLPSYYIDNEQYTNNEHTTTTNDELLIKNQIKGETNNDETNKTSNREIL